MKSVETLPQLATAVTARKSGEPSEKPSAGGTPQNTSGMSGQITASGPGAAGPQGASAENIRHIEDTAGSNDLGRCRDITQTMRRSGVAMPAPLLALAAMSPQLLEAASRP
ncbi:hypothetical protein MEX01_21240 [Methylorubrum extorquens]|uniref:hypothetical protein n=1 Tax=Methylorubrum extorquens TaxID=408 RepID=UPI001175BBC4|nr:hypothetical protein [Methylorubrum extorquens]GEL41533.1 hypothetical protein MEX01_21240 [Methylorubrum extorquens]